MSTSTRRAFALRGAAAALLVLATAFVIQSTSHRPALAAQVDVAGTPLKFNYAATDSLTGSANPTGKNNGDRVVYRNVATISGLVIDAVVTTTLTNASIGNYDNPGSASSSSPIPGTVAADNFQVDMTTSAVNGTTSFAFAFYEGGTYTTAGSGTRVTLQHVNVTSIDLDTSGSSDFQYTDLTGFQSYTLSSSPASALQVSNPSPGVVRFKATYNANGPNRPEDRVQVSYDTVETFTAVFGNVASGKLGYFGLLFVADAWAGCNCTTANVVNSYNVPPTSSSTTLRVAADAPTVLTLAQFGNYADADGNPFAAVEITSLPATGILERFVDGAWTAVEDGDSIPTADIQLGQLRFTGSGSDAVGFKVFDGLALSTSVRV